MALLPALAQPLLAATLEQAVGHCRETVGRPMVETCMADRGKSGAFETCRVRATPQVRACVRETVIGATGRSTFTQAIGHCRETVGRPIVQACMRGSGPRADLDACRHTAAPKVRACVQGRMLATYGRSNFEQAIEHCRETVGRPLVHACMIDQDKTDDLEACRAEATPKVQACVQKAVGAAR